MLLVNITRLFAEPRLASRCNR